MKAEISTVDRILDAAERRMRAQGYNAVSFRELAAEIGIKSASIHYHFPSKADLGVAVVQRYHQRFLAALWDMAETQADPAVRLRGFVEAYRRALLDDDMICLCGMLGAESGGLPSVVVAEVRRFFQANIDWLVDASAAARPRSEAARIVSTLQGAMILASTLGDQTMFDEVAAGVTGEAGEAVLT